MYTRRIDSFRLAALLVCCSFLLNNVAFARGFGSMGGHFEGGENFRSNDFGGGPRDFGDHWSGGLGADRDDFVHSGGGIDRGDFANRDDWANHNNGVWQRNDWGNHPLQPIATDGGFGRFANHPNFDNYNHIGNNTYNFDRNTFVNNGNIVRGNYDHWGAFNDGWWGGHPGCWYGGWPPNYCWGNTSWMMMAPFLGMTTGMMMGMGLGALANNGGGGNNNSSSTTTVVTSPPVEYEYGNNIYYNGNNVYYGSQPVATAGQYYDQASALAQSAPALPSNFTGANAPKAKDWKPFGVFSLVQAGQTDSTTVFQLAVNKDGVIRGNYYNTLTEETKPLNGALDKKSMRACWSVKGAKDVVYDTGVANLMEAQSPILVHFGKDRTQQMMLVRLQQPQTPGQTPPTKVSHHPPVIF